MDAKKVLKYVVLTVVLGNVVLLAFVFLGSPSHKPTPMPNPNGYDDFVKAGGMVTRPKGFGSNMTKEELSAFIATNEDALKLGRIGLSRQCRMPDDYSRQYFERFWQESAGIGALARAYSAQARLAEMENRTNDAVDAYLASVELGEKSSHGGFVAPKFVGIYCEEIGRQGLQSFTSNLPPGLCREVTAKLETVDAEEESFSEIWTHTKKVIRDASTLREKLKSWREFLTIGEFKRDSKSKFDANARERRKLMVTFAARAYELEKGKPPVTIADLVPNYLKAIPKDPVTGTNMVLVP